MEVLNLNENGKLATDEVLDIFKIVESYLFRRNICDVPANSLNKIFLLLNKEIIRYDGSTDDYVAKLLYAILSKKDSGRFPDDEEFAAALSTKQIYLMRGKYKAYLFERFENGGTLESKDIYAHLDRNEYTIEHIMPQHLTPAWAEALGPDASTIHETWLHRLANLTLTAYNPNLSDNSFQEKRDAKNGGYLASGLRMNQRIARKESWGLEELEERNRYMVQDALKIWPRPKTAFRPEKKEFDSASLADEEIDFTGKAIVQYRYLNSEHPVQSWSEMFDEIVRYLHRKDKSVLASLAYGTASEGLGLLGYVSNKPATLRKAAEIDNGIFIEKNTSTAAKISMLRKLFALYDADPTDLVFYLKDIEHKKLHGDARFDIRFKYWEYALPIIQESNSGRKSFLKCKPTSNNGITGYLGLRGCCIRCASNFDRARVDFCLTADALSKNKARFDSLYRHKDEIENKLGVALIWYRDEHAKGSLLGYHLHGVNIENESDWPRMAAFQAEWSNKICEAVIPYLQEISGSDSQSRSSSKSAAVGSGRCLGSRLMQSSTITLAWVTANENSSIMVIHLANTPFRFFRE